jgi:short-subunit dehydrogenase
MQDMIPRLLLWSAVAGAAYLGWKKRRPAAPPRSLRGAVVLITGASAGIGRATAGVFAAQGAHVALVARRAQLLAEVEAELAAYDGERLVIPADITLEKDLKRAAADVTERFGRVDVLVNNAGLALGGPLHEQPPADVRRVINLNLTALIRLTQLVLPGMLERQRGHIVNVSSVSGLMAAPGTTVYAATKAAVNTFSDALRREVKRHGIGVSVVIPGWVRTAMIANMGQEQMRRANITNPLMPIDRPETIAAAIMDVVRYNRRQVLIGGPGFYAGALAARMAPELLDVLFRHYYDTDAMLAVLKDGGV